MTTATPGTITPWPPTPRSPPVMSAWRSRPRGSIPEITTTIPAPLLAQAQVCLCVCECETRLQFDNFHQSSRFSWLTNTWFSLSCSMTFLFQLYDARSFHNRYASRFSSNQFLNFNLGSNTIPSHSPKPNVKHWTFDKIKPRAVAAAENVKSGLLHLKVLIIVIPDPRSLVHGQRLNDHYR